MTSYTKLFTDSGALAKGFAHTFQRACAVNDNSPDRIIASINRNLSTQSSSNMPQQNLLSLENKLNEDKDKFKNLNALKNIHGITVYALAAPGVSNETDKHGTWLTYYHQPDFLRVFHHFHKEDIIPKFGESDFLSGKYGVARILANKAIQYETPVIEHWTRTLPFPGVTNHVKNAHATSVSGNSEMDKISVTDAAASTHITEKFIFSRSRHVFYNSALFVAQKLASVDIIAKHCSFFRTIPTKPVSVPNIIGDKNLLMFHKL